MRVSITVFCWGGATALPYSSTHNPLADAMPGSFPPFMTCCAAALGYSNRSSNRSSNQEPPARLPQAPVHLHAPVHLLLQAPVHLHFLAQAFVSLKRMYRPNLAKPSILCHKTFEANFAAAWAAHLAADLGRQRISQSSARRASRLPGRPPSLRPHGVR